MNLRSPAKLLMERLAAFAPAQDIIPRVLAMYAASIATADDDAMRTALQFGHSQGVTRARGYEVVLQSYLFLGFPRMLLAVETLNRVMPKGARPVAEPNGDEYSLHAESGLALCKEIYGTAFEPLRTRIESGAPEVFRWMIREGYGKVMSRPGLNKMEREVCSVAFLIMEGYEQQLHSHMRGALNVGAPAGLLAAVIDDIGPAGGPGSVSARRILENIGSR
jgi:4-carboxymuconolactone decarboxylase